MRRDRGAGWPPRIAKKGKNPFATRRYKKDKIQGMFLFVIFCGEIQLILLYVFCASAVKRSAALAI